MKKYAIFLTLFIAFGLVFSACAPVASNPPEFTGGAGAQQAINLGARQLEELAREQYGLDEMALPGSFSYTIALSESEPLLWA